MAMTVVDIALTRRRTRTARGFMKAGSCNACGSGNPSVKTCSAIASAPCGTDEYVLSPTNAKSRGLRREVYPSSTAQHSTHPHSTGCARSCVLKKGRHFGTLLKLVIVSHVLPLCQAVNAFSAFATVGSCLCCKAVVIGLGSGCLFCAPHDFSKEPKPRIREIQIRLFRQVSLSGLAFFSFASPFSSVGGIENRSSSFTGAPNTPALLFRFGVPGEPPGNSRQPLCWDFRRIRIEQPRFMIFLLRGTEAFQRAVFPITEEDGLVVCTVGPLYKPF